MAQIELYHSAPAVISADQSTTITLDVRAGFTQINTVWFFYRASGDLSYTEEEMVPGTESQPEFTIDLKNPGNFEAGLEYYFIAFDKNNVPVSLPASQPELSPYRVTVENIPKTESPFVLLAPDKNLSDNDGDFFVAISYFSLGDTMDAESIRFMFNGKDVSSDVTVSSNMILYKPRKKPVGRVVYSLEATLTDGSKVSSPQWVSTIATKTVELPLDMYGHASVNLYSFNENRDDGDDNDFRSNLNFTLGGHHNWLRFASRIYLSSEEDKDMQPVNRYNLTLNVPHFELVTGDYTPNYGTFTASGRNVRGIHANMRFKYFSLLASYGQSRRSIDGSVTVDSMGVATNNGGTFRRNNIALRTESGNPGKFLWGFTITKSKDDVKSLDKEDYMNLATENPQPTVTPKDNVVISTDARLSLFKQRLVWGAEAAMSLYNSNILGGALSLDSLEANLDQEIDLPFDPADFEDFFVINENIEPIEPGTANLAYRTYLRMYFLKNLLNVSYSAVGRSYNSLSSSYLQKDSRVISVFDNINLLRNQLILTGGLTITTDNVYDEKDITNTNTNYYVQLLARPTNLPYFNVGYNANLSKNDADDPDPDDAYKESKEISTSGISLGTGYMVDAIDFAPTNFTVTYSNTVNSDDAYNAFETTRNNISLSMKSEFAELPLETQISYTISLGSSEQEDITKDTRYNSIYLRGLMKFMDDRLKPYADLRLVGYGGDQDAQSSHLVNLGASYNLTNNTFLSTNLGMKMYANDDVEGQDYSQFNWRFKISQKF